MSGNTEQIINYAQTASTDASIASVASKATVYGWAGSMFGFLTDAGIAVAIGTVITVAGFLLNWYFQRRVKKKELELIESKDKRDAEQHEWARAEHLARMEVIKGEQCNKAL